jgi:ribosomal protein S18 acetylase RimI-like enzyme
MKSYRITEKPDFISYDQIQALLTRSHQTNAEKNLLYATASQTTEQFVRKIQGGVCFVALLDGTDQLIGTVSVTPIRQNYWYHHGPAALVKLMGVDPDFRGMRISSALLEKSMEYARQQGFSVMVTDSAEENTAIRHLFTGHGFHIVDYCLYAANNFYTTVYAYWQDGCPHSRFRRFIRYQAKRARIRIQYKPGKISRFSFFQQR